MQYSRLNSDSKSERFGDKKPASSVMKVHEEQIWERFKKGDKAALTFIYENYSDQLFNYGCQFNLSSEIVKDAVHDLFIDLINRKSNLGSTDSIKFYLFKALRNKLVRILSNHSKNPSEQFHPEKAFQIAFSHEVIMINQQMDQEKQQIIASKLNELAPLQKEALLLYFYEGLTYEQIANIFGMKVKSARALVYRGIHSITQLLSPLRDKLS